LLLKETINEDSIKVQLEYLTSNDYTLKIEIEDN